MSNEVPLEAAPEPSLVDYVKGIDDARANGHTVNVDFGSLPETVDPKMLATALSKGLSGDYSKHIQDAAANGHTLVLDYSQATPDATEPIKAGVSNVAHEVLETGNQIAGGIAGGAAGAMVGAPTAGATVGAGLMKLRGRLMADAIDTAMNYTNPKYPPMDQVDMAKKVVVGGAEQLAGDKVLGPIIGATAKGMQKLVQKLAPGFLDFLTNQGTKVGETVIKDPAILEQNAGSEETIREGVTAMQKSLKALHENASAAYDEVRAAAGIPIDRSADAAAKELAQTGGKAMSVKEIGTAFKDLKDKLPSMTPEKALEALETLKQNVNAHLNPIKPTESLGVETTKAQLKLGDIKTGIVNFMKQIPHGEDMLAAGEEWAHMQRLQGILKDVFSETGPAMEAVQKIFTEDGTKYETERAAMQMLDDRLGVPVSQKLEKEVIAHAANRWLPTNIMAKRQAIMAVAALSPGRFVSVPTLLASQSPRLMNRAAIGAGNLAAKIASDAGPLGGGLMSQADKLSSMSGNPQ